MHVFHDVCSDDSVQICFHEIEDEIDIFVILGFQNI